MLTIAQKIQVLNHLMPDCSRYVDGDTLVWLDERPLPTDAVLEMMWYNINLAHVKQAKQAEIILKRDETLAKGYHWMFNGDTPDVVGITVEHQINLIGMALKAILQESDPDAVIRTRAASNADRYMTVPETKAMALGAYARIEEIYLHSWDLRDQTVAATTVEEVATIIWTLE